MKNEFSLKNVTKKIDIFYVTVKKRAFLQFFKFKHVQSYQASNMILAQITEIWQKSPLILVF